MRARTLTTLLAGFPRDDTRLGPRRAGEVQPGITVAPADSEPDGLEALTITDRHARINQLTGWAQEADLAVLHRDEASLTVTEPHLAPRYVTSRAAADAHHLHDRLNGYDLTHTAYPDGREAWQAAQQLNTDPLAAAQAVTAHDNALVTSSPAGAVLLDIRRYGHRGSLQAREVEAVHRQEMLCGWLVDKALWRVWSEDGTPYYVTPDRWRTLPVQWRRIDGARWPTTPLSQVRRPVVAWKDTLPCDWHHRPYCAHPACHPGAVWECVGPCEGANAVTAVHGRPMCNRCAPDAAARTAPARGPVPERAAAR